MLNKIIRYALAALFAAMFIQSPIAEAAYPTPYAKIQFFDNVGNPLAGGKIYSYAAGTLTPKSTYTDAGEGTPNANPVVMDSAGRANIWLGTGGYKLILKTSADSTIWTVDNVPGNGSFSGNLSVSGNATIGGTLGITGNTALSGTLATTGAVTLSSTLTATGAISSSSTITAAAVIPTGSSPPVNGLYLNSANTPAITANSITVARFLTAVTGVNYIDFSAAATGANPSISTNGSDVNPPLDIVTKGSGYILFQSQAGGASNFRIDDCGGSCVDFLTTSGSIAGSPGSGSITAFGADTNINVSVLPKGTGKIITGSTTSITSYNTPKAMARIAWSGGVPSLIGNSNLNTSSVSDTGTGDVTINLGVTFASTDDIIANCIVYDTGSNSWKYSVRALTTTSVRVQMLNSGGSLADPSGLMCTFFGKI